MKTQARYLVLLTAAVVAGSAIVYAANVDKALADTEGRRKAAENGLRDIKKKAPDPSEQVRSAYVAAANGHNAWLAQICEAVDGGAMTMPDTAPAATTAAAALVDWVAVRNRSLEMPVMTSELADSVKKAVVQDLQNIADFTWKSARGADQMRRKRITGDLKTRMQWKTWENVG